MNVLNYFTDGSVTFNNQTQIQKGTCGFVSVKDNKLIDSLVCDTIPEINFCEAAAINLAIANIYQITSNYERIYIYSDSGCCVDGIRNIIYWKCFNAQKPSWYNSTLMKPFQIEIVKAANGIIYLTSYIDLRLIKIRSHVSMKDQIKHFKKYYNEKIDNGRAYIIKNGNALIDSMVSTTINYNQYNPVPVYVL